MTGGSISSFENSLTMSASGWNQRPDAVLKARHELAIYPLIEESAHEDSESGWEYQKSEEAA